MFKLNTKFDADSLLYSLSHSECDGHTVHMLTLQNLLPPLTSTVMLSLFTHAHPVHSPWLPGFTGVAQTIFLILTVVGLFPDRLYIYFFNFIFLPLICKANSASTSVGYVQMGIVQFLSSLIHLIDLFFHL